ncbi:MAG: bifunctional phosphopantothenoylcysteine decarboxylase/phosphopantothenate--cysteine ligase CoaBC [Propionibacteriaceae bacterium]
MSRIVLGVAGGIAAYKACELLRRLSESGHEVTVVPTRAALDFVGRTTWEALSGHPVHTDTQSDAYQVPHVQLGRQADLVIIAPATADLIARAAQGRADDLLTNVLLTATCPVIMAPAMHTEMWQHLATRSNVATLRSRGIMIIEPASGRLTGADSGPGRLPEPSEIAADVLAVLDNPKLATYAAAQDMADRHVVVSAGGTHEFLDPVRFLGNESSGRMGIALARAAALRGADVDLVAAHITVPLPSGIRVTRVVSTQDLADAVVPLAANADITVMAAAPADFTPREPSGTKIKKSTDVATGKHTLALDLVETVDVLKTISSTKQSHQVIVGFAAETTADKAALVDTATAKLRRKGCDLLVANDVSAGAVFGSDHNDVVILNATGIVAEASGTKASVAHCIWDKALDALSHR